LLSVNGGPYTQYADNSHYPETRTHPTHMLPHVSGWGGYRRFNEPRIAGFGNGSDLGHDSFPFSCCDHSAADCFQSCVAQAALKIFPLFS
jgi:hypothetical protein